MGMGPNATYVCRPTLCSDCYRHELVCVWEQFDSANVDGNTALLRADIWAARGDSTGTIWGVPRRITGPDSTSKRFPCLAGCTRNDTCLVLYEEDEMAGFGVQRVGLLTRNPIVVQWVPVTELPAAGVEEGPGTIPGPWPLVPGPTDLEIGPNPCGGILNVRIQGWADTQVRPYAGTVTIRDVAGRPVRSVGLKLSDFSSSHSVDLRSLPNGVYFVTVGLQAEGFKPHAVRKIVLSKGSRQ